MTEYVHLNEAGFRDRLTAERKKLEKLEASQRKAGRHELSMMTTGRISGMYLALSFLEEYLVREQDRAE